MNPVVHFEMPYKDRNRMVGFYESAFGWKHELLGPEMADYVVARTTEIDPQTGFPTEPGRINGGFYQSTDDTACPSFVIAVEDVAATLERITAAGGTILAAPAPIPGVGLYASFADTEGNRCSILQPEMP
jgi:predicted enzyme related to lactoylglutathione lyase